MSVKYFFKSFFYSRFFYGFLKYIIIQNIITIALLPIYASWGISFSTLVWLGNLFFLPFLTSYLFVCLVILILFFFEIFSLFLVSIHNAIIDWWMWVLDLLSYWLPYWKICGVDYAPYSYFFYWGVVFLLVHGNFQKYSLPVRAVVSSLACLICLTVFVSLPPLKKVFIDESGLIPETYLLTGGSRVSILGKQRLRGIEKRIKYTYLRNIRKYFGIAVPQISFVYISNTYKKIKK